LGFTTLQLLQLWGEIFHWAILVENLKLCPYVKGKTAHEVWTGTPPHIQTLRLLPIFSVVKVYRYTADKERLNQSAGPHYTYGLYVGPCHKAAGVIRVAILVNAKIYIVRTSKYKGVSDGGDAVMHEHIEHGVDLLLQDHVAEITDQPTSHVYEIADEPIFQNPVSSPVEPAHHGAGEEGTADDFSSNDSQTDHLRDKPETSPTSPSHQYDTRTAAKKKKNVHVHWSQSTESTDETRAEPTVPKTNTASTPRSRKTLGRNYQTTRRGTHSRHTGAQYAEEIYLACYADWSQHKNDTYYYDFLQNTFVSVNPTALPMDCYVAVEEGYAAVSEGVPKDFQAALAHPLWGDPARDELNKLVSEKGTLVEVDKTIAIEAKKSGADLVILFPVYEKKIRDGKEVYKVRLVCNGKHQHNPDKHTHLLLLVKNFSFSFTLLPTTIGISVTSMKPEHSSIRSIKEPLTCTLASLAQRVIIK
jgi:hypothetical protein